MEDFIQNDIIIKGLEDRKELQKFVSETLYQLEENIGEYTFPIKISIELSAKDKTNR